MRVLHVPYCYFPDPIGGTEVYVGSLCAELARLGIECAVAAPAKAASSYWHDAVHVERFATMAEPGFAEAWGAADREAAGGFEAIVARFQPEVVHFHARTSAVSAELAARARDHGAKVVLTYHAPTFSCSRGTMLYRGREPCDGDLQPGRCGRCVLEGLGMPGPVARWASSPLGIGLSAHSRGRARLPWLIAERCRDTRALLAQADHVVAVCEWVKALLLRNGVPEHRLTLSRQGVAEPMPDLPARAARAPGSPLKIAYYGRADRTKGMDLIVEAVLAARRAKLTLDLHIIEPEGYGALDNLRAKCAQDARFAFRAPVQPGQVVASMAEFDLIAVPSTWMETGPLVVLEAQAAGTPVLGAARGGIAELVRDGVDGMLLPPGDVAAWSQALDRLAQTPAEVERLRGNVRPPRTMRDAAADMAALYRRLVEPNGADAKAAAA